MLRTCLSLLLLVFAAAAQGAMVLPPPMESDADYDRFAREILREMPSLPTHSYPLATITNMVRQMDRLRDRLITNREFNALAAERPDLKVFRFYTYRTQTVSRLSVTPEFAESVRAHFQSNYASLLVENEEAFHERLRADIQGLAGAVALEQTSGIIAGLSGVFPPEKRREILSKPALDERRKALREALLAADEAKIQSVFDSERFGIPRAEFTKTHAIELLDRAVNREIELTRAISILDVYTNGDVAAISAENIQWFTAEESGLELSVDPQIFGRIRSQASKSFAIAEENVEVEIPETELIVRELPPHLGVFRGCPGGDCSTSSSWAYPFSPLERDFFVYLKGNRFQELGYVSGNITTVKGKPTLFIRDITGKLMSPEHVDILIQGFAQVLREMGTKQMTIAAPNFHQAQNHFGPLKNRIIRAINPFSTVGQTFGDVALRKRYLDQVVSSAHYDAPSIHTKVKLYDARSANARLPKVRAVTINLEELTNGRGGVHELMQRIQIAYSSRSVSFLSGAHPEFRQWGSLIALLRNSSRRTLAQYYSELEKTFAKLGVTLSRSLRERYADLFVKGHLNASNAFRGAEAERSFQIIVDIYMQKRDVSIFSKVRSRKAEFFASAPFQKMIQEILTRRRPADQERVNQLWTGLGYHFDDITLTGEQVDFLATHVGVPWGPSALNFADVLIKNGRIENPPESLLNVLRGFITDRRQVYRYQYGYHYARSPHAIPAMLAVGHFTFRNHLLHAIVKNEFIQRDHLPSRFAAAVALLSSKYEQETYVGARMLNFIVEHIDDREIPESLRVKAKAFLDQLDPRLRAEMEARHERWLKTADGKLELARRCARKATSKKSRSR